MLPHIRNDIKTTPVSRVGSHQRLHQLTGTPKSIPSTPSAYTTSSLNPTRHLPVTPSNMYSKITSASDLEAFEKLPVVQQVNLMDSLFSEICIDISAFREDQLEDKVRSIIQVNDNLQAKIDMLEEHRELGQQIEELTREQTDLNAEAKRILRELISHRTRLKSLARAPAQNKVRTNDVDVSDILKYAMKLAKFTKAPAAMGNMQLQVHPNNYVWPAEDALRRGMLASASLQEDLLIKHELGEVEPEVEKEKTPVESPKERKSSFSYATEKPEKKEEKKEEVNLDLDLFDPDDEFSD